MADTPWTLAPVTPQTRHMTGVAELLPVLGLRLRSEDLELRGLTDADLVVLCDLAAQGIHPPERMPFRVPWTDAPPAELRRNAAQYHWRARADFTPERWALHLGVWQAGVLIGSQGFETEHYLVTRTGETGSWLGAEHQGRGLGTRMRRMICAFAFDHLDAAEVTSAAFLDNPGSLAVSRKVGYRENGVRRLQRRPGELAHSVELALAPEDFDRGDVVLEVAGVDAFRAAIGLPPSGFRDGSTDLAE